MKDKNDNAKKIFCVVIAVVAIVFGYLALLNNRYTKVDQGYIQIYDKWKREYIDIRDNK